MKPRFAKEIVATKIKRPEGHRYTDNEYSPLENGLLIPDRYYYWQALRSVIESIEEAGYKVSITKDGKEYNQ